MSDRREVIPGVRVDDWVTHAEFECGSLFQLAEGLRNLLWSDSSLFADTKMLIVRVGGAQRKAQEPVIEVESWQPGVPYETITISHAMRDAMKVVRKANTPASCYATWPCDCDEYCDQDHGEGRLELFVFKPSFHEMAAALTI